MAGEKLPRGARQSLFVPRLIKMIITFNCYFTMLIWHKRKSGKGRNRLDDFFVFNCGAEKKAKREKNVIRNDL